jgi:hypothetical protein
VFFSVSTRLLASACLDGAGGGVTLEQKEVYPGVDPVSPNIRPSPPRSRKKKKDIRLAAGLFFFFWRNFGTHGVVDGSTIREYPSEIL